MLARMLHPVISIMSTNLQQANSDQNKSTPPASAFPRTSSRKIPYLEFQLGHNSATHSICEVWGNMSTGWTRHGP